MSDDIIELIDNLGLERVLGIGHDFGATLLSRAVAYYPKRFSKLVFLSVGPPKMGSPFNLEGINTMTKQVLGYEWLGYISWIGVQEGAQKVLEEHAESAMSLIFCSDASEWSKWYRPLGRMKRFIMEDRKVKIGDWYTPELQHNHLAAFAQKDGYKGATRWYQMWTENLFAPDEKGLESVEITQPVLFVGDKGSSQQKDLLAAWATDMTAVEVESGHWVHLECANETNDAIESFLTA